jgi:hypothetical protein
MNSYHLDHIETAFHQLSFAIKLWHYTDTEKIDKGIFDIDLTIQDESNCIVLHGNEFESYTDLIVASENNISICFGAAALTLWEAIREKTSYEPRQLDPLADIKQNLASLSYMIRCCFAHGTAVPVWSIFNVKYKTQYRLGNKVVDLSNVSNGQAFDYSSIGGYETLWFLKNEAKAHQIL